LPSPDASGLPATGQPSVTTPGALRESGGRSSGTGRTASGVRLDPIRAPGLKVKVKCVFMAMKLVFWRDAD